MREWIAVFLFAIVVSATDDCTSHCKQWSSPLATVRLQFTPCTLSIQNFHVDYSGTVVEGNDGLSVAECVSSGSGTQLSISVPTARGAAALTWTYSQSDSTAVCSALRGAGTDLTLTLLGFSVVVPGSPLATWSAADGSLCTADCVDSIDSSSGVFASVLAQPACYSNAGARYRLLSGEDALMLEWHFSTLLDGTVTDVSLLTNGTAIDASQPGFKCIYNLGITLLQVYDAATNRWALSWTYHDYTSCAELLAALASDSDGAPAVESAVVVVSLGGQTFAWERDASEQDVTTRLSDRQVACAGSTPSASPIPSAAPSPSAGPALARPVQPFVDCVYVGHPGPCYARFGYYNPNSWPITLLPHTSANQLVRDKNVEHTPLPSIFLPGVHNASLAISYPCNHNGLPSMAWKLRTPVPIEIAALLENTECAHSCTADLVYNLEHCSPLATPQQQGAFNDDETESVMRCARSEPGAAPVCVFQ